MNLIRTFLPVAVLALAVQAQTVNTPNTCMGSQILTAYSLAPQSPSIVNNGTCTYYFQQNGACVTPWSVISAMNRHNIWLAYKALDAQQYGMQYVNQTAYFMIANGVITNATLTADRSWYNYLEMTWLGWWGLVTNQYTSIFKRAQTWIRKVFMGYMDHIVPCIQTWGNLTNGAYCLSSSAHSFPFRTDMGAGTGDLGLGVDRLSTGQALASCERLIDVYCQMNYGISIYNDSLPFNQTFDWSDGGLSNATCMTIKNNLKCNATSNCMINLYETYINLFESHFIRFIPSNQTQKSLGNFLLTINRTGVAFTPTPAAASSGKSFRLYTSTDSGVNLMNVGEQSGQPDRDYVINSAGVVAAIVAGVVSVLFV
jgi:hypothetical protein